MKVVVIPVFNEEKSIFNIISNVFDYCDKIVVVNDCSTDRSKEIIESINNDNLVLITNEKKLELVEQQKLGLRNH